MLDLIRILGFTGTQNGMRKLQRYEFRNFAFQYKPSEFHHGDCIGADAEAHEIVRLFLPECKIVIHPPLDPKKRAWCEGDVILPEKDYLDRNKDIVTVSTKLVATPNERIEQVRSGTWSTVRFARKTKREEDIILILPKEKK